RTGGQDSAREAASSIVRTGGNRVAAAVRVSVSTAVAASSQADLRRARQISRPPIRAATSATSRIHTHGLRPLEVPVAAAAEAAGVGLGGAAAAVVGGGAAAAVVGGGA